MGRDVYSRIVYGARISLAVGCGSMSLGVSIGVVIGLLSGYLGGWIDLVAQRLIDILQSLPLLVMALLMAASLGPSLHNTIIAISIPLIPYSARVVRANTLSLREQPFVESAKAIGMSELRIALRHVLPNTLGAAHRPGDRAVRLDDPDRGDALVPWPRHSRAASVMGPHAVGIGRRICPDRAVAGDLPRSGDQLCRVRHQSARRRVARHSRPAATQLIAPLHLNPTDHT